MKPEYKKFICVLVLTSALLGIIPFMYGLNLISSVINFITVFLSLLVSFILVEFYFYIRELKHRQDDEHLAEGN